MTREYRQRGFIRPPGATEVLLIRHGESRAATAERPFPLVDGHGDPELHPDGRLQADRLAERLRDQPIAAIYVTNLRRTTETAAPLCRALGLTPVVVPELREVHLGDWEGGLLRIKAHDNDPIYQRVIAEQRWDVIPNAESRERFHVRVMRGLARIVAAHRDQLVAAVVHGGVIAHVLAQATAARPFAFNGADNASISHIVVLPSDTIVLRRFNDTAHLTPVLTTKASELT